MSTTPRKNLKRLLLKSADARERIGVDTAENEQQLFHNILGKIVIGELRIPKRCKGVQRGPCGSAHLGGAAPGRGVITQYFPGTACGRFPPGLGRASGALRGSGIARCVPGPVRYAGSDFFHLSIGSGGLRAWLCSFVFVFDALRCVLDRRILKLLRINGFHLLNLCSAYSHLLS